MTNIEDIKAGQTVSVAYEGGIVAYTTRDDMVAVTNPATNTNNFFPASQVTITEQPSPYVVGKHYMSKYGGVWKYTDNGWIRYQNGWPTPSISYAPDGPLIEVTLGDVINP